MLGAMDSAVVVASNWSRAHTAKASMPMKCMAQMPPPSAMVPDPRAIWRTNPVSARRASAAISSASTDASMAISTDNATNQRSCAHKNGKD